MQLRTLLFIFRLGDHVYKSLSNCTEDKHKAFMSFFNHVQLHKYDITDKGISQACYDELVMSGNNSTEEQLRVLADDMREQFKDYMRPLFA